MKFTSATRSFAGIALCMAVLGAPLAANAAEPAATEKKQPAKAAPKKVAPKKVEAKRPEGKKVVASKTAETEEQVKEKLQEFAKVTLAKMNALSLPSKNKKEVIKNADGSYTARYVEIDVNSISTDVHRVDKGEVSHIGYMRYVEADMVNTAKTKAEAEAGPFKAKSKEGLTELVKYMNKKWGY